MSNATMTVPRVGVHSLISSMPEPGTEKQEFTLANFSATVPSELSYLLRNRNRSYPLQFLSNSAECTVLFLQCQSQEQEQEFTFAIYQQQCREYECTVIFSQCQSQEQEKEFTFPISQQQCRQQECTVIFPQCQSQEQEFTISISQCKCREYMSANIKIYP